MSGNRLTLKPPAGPNGNQQRLTWERIPDLPNPTAEQKKFVGFWKLISNERRSDKGELLSSNPGQHGYIIYTAAGFMTVHMVQPDRKPYAATQPTPRRRGRICAPTRITSARSTSTKPTVTSSTISSAR